MIHRKFNHSPASIPRSRSAVPHGLTLANGRPELRKATTKIMKDNAEPSLMKRRRNPMALLCGILFMVSCVGVYTLTRDGSERSLGNYVGMSVLPVVFLVGTVFYWQKKSG